MSTPTVTELKKGKPICTQGMRTVVWEYVVEFPDGSTKRSTVELDPVYSEAMTRDLLLVHARYTWRCKTTLRTVRIALAEVGWAVWIVWDDDETLDGVVYTSPSVPNTEYPTPELWARACAEALCEEHDLPANAIEEVATSAIPS